MRVTVINESNHDLFLNNINVLDRGQPIVWLSVNDPSGSSAPIDFDIRRDQAPTIIEIRNRTARNILFSGTVENPIGITFVENTGGNVRSVRSRDIGDSTGANRVSLIRTNILRIEVANGNVGQSTSQRLNVDIVDANSVPRGTTFRTGRISPITGAIYLGFENQFFTGQLVQYTSSSAEFPLVSGNYYFVLVQPDTLSIKLARTDTPTTAEPLLPITSDLLTLHTLMPVTRFSVRAPNGAAWMDLEAHDRSTVGDPYTVIIDDVTTKFDADLFLRVSKRDPGTGNSGGIKVKDRPIPAGTPYFAHYKTPDPATTAPFHAGFGIGLDGNPAFEAPTTSIYDFRQKDTAGNRTLPGITSTNEDIIIESERVEVTEPFTHVRGIFEGSDTGHVDVLTNGWIAIYEDTQDFRVGRIKSTANYVILWSPRMIIDALDDGGYADEADVAGTDITMCPGVRRPNDMPARTPSDADCADGNRLTGGVGTPDNFLEINVDVLNGSPLGVLRVFDTFADNTQGIYLDELVGDMKIHTIHTYGGTIDTLESGNSSLRTVDGSIVDARNGGAGDEDADVLGQTVDIDANGTAGRGSIGSSGNDLEIDSLRSSSSLHGHGPNKSCFNTAAVRVGSGLRRSRRRRVEATQSSTSPRRTATCVCPRARGAREHPPDRPRVRRLDEDLYLISNGDARFAEAPTARRRVTSTRRARS